MRVSLAGAVLVLVLVALVAAVVLGIGHAPLPTELPASLVEVRSDAAGQPLVEVEDAGDGALGVFGVGDGTLLVRPDQFLCRGGSLTDLVPGLPVVVSGPEPVDVGGAGGPVATADLVVIECGG